MNMIVPVGDPEPGLLAVRVAVKVTLCPKTLGLPEVATTILVAAWSILSVSTAELQVDP